MSPLVQPAGDENIQRVVSAGELMDELLESVNGSAGALLDGGDKSCASFGVGHKGARVP
jgi:hypothetical protein